MSEGSVVGCFYWFGTLPEVALDETLPIFGSLPFIPCFNCFPFQFRGQDYGFDCNSSLVIANL